MVEQRAQLSGWLAAHCPADMSGSTDADDHRHKMKTDEEAVSTFQEGEDVISVLLHNLARPLTHSSLHAMKTVGRPS